MRPRRAPYPRLAEAGGEDKGSRVLDGICTRPDLTSGGTTLPPLPWLLSGYLLPVPIRDKPTYVGIITQLGADRLMHQRARCQLPPGFSLTPGPNHSD